MGTDPAMLVWLDTATSTKAAPNENYARELMELFSLGIGNYTETDIRQAAKAFTGYEIKEGKGTLSTVGSTTRAKRTCSARRGNLPVKTSRKLCLEHDACAKFIVRQTLPLLD